VKLATWNVNSVRARLERVLGWIDEHRPDVLCLQETKVEDPKFPSEPFSARGYAIATFGQKTYNGVAILSRTPLLDIERGFGDGVEDPQARFLCATTCGIRVASAYVPNGQAVGSDKFAYKLRWLERLCGYVTRTLDPKTPSLLCGDFNVAPTDLDVWDPAVWEGQVLFTREEREALERVREAGLVDLLRHLHPSGAHFTWWDYRQLAFPKNLGLRIDHIFVTPVLAAKATGVHVDREARKGKLPSDHAPVVAELRDD
jgi:exodeoxyribonuclease-3